MEDREFAVEVSVDVHEGGIDDEQATELIKLHSTARTYRLLYVVGLCICMYILPVIVESEHCVVRIRSQFPLKRSTV